MEKELVIGDNGVTMYQALVVRQGLKACLIGMRLNSAYTPTNCKKMASKFTGKKYGTGKEALRAAIADITVVIDEAAPAVKEAGTISNGMAAHA
jgi:hypothetical protein